MYSVAKVKTFIGHEGHGFNAELLEDGKKIAFVIDDASGSPFYSWTWFDQAAKERMNTFLKNDPKWSKDDFCAIDSFIGHLIDEYEGAKKLKSLCKRRAVISVKGDKEGEYRTFKLKYKPELRDKLVASCDKLFGVGNWESVNEKLCVW